MFNSSETTELTLKEKDLIPRNPTVLSNEPIDLELIKAFRNSSIGSRNKFCVETRTLIENVLEKGVSLNTAACYAGVSPVTLRRWITEGLEDINNYTDEMCNSGIDLSDKGKFAIECMQRTSKAVVDMNDGLWDRAFETGKEWVSVWYLERLDPDKYNLKHKSESNIDVNANISSEVKFSFIDGESTYIKKDDATDDYIVKERSSEETAFINAKLLQLDKKWDASGDKEDYVH